MIRDLSETELEQASGGFDISDLRLITSPASRMSSVALVGMAPPNRLLMPIEAAAPTEVNRTPFIDESSISICRNRRDRYSICQDDGVHERWERYRPQQPSYRSRFINR